MIFAGTEGNSTSYRCLHSHKTLADPLELEFAATVSDSMKILGTELGWSKTVIHAVTISPASEDEFLTVHKPPIYSDAVWWIKCFHRDSVVHWISLPIGHFIVLSCPLICDSNNFLQSKKCTNLCRHPTLLTLSLSMWMSFSNGIWKWTQTQ